MIGLSPSTYYYQPKRSRESREREDAELRDAIESIQTEFPVNDRPYGANPGSR